MVVIQIRNYAFTILVDEYMYTFKVPLFVLITTEQSINGDTIINQCVRKSLL